MHTVKGEMDIGGQYHHQMETHTVRAVPREDDQLDLFSATQDMRDVCFVASQLTGLSENKSVAGRRWRDIWFPCCYSVNSTVWHISRDKKISSKSEQ